MYLLEAKKRAEKEYKKQQEKERKEARERARREVKQQAKAAKEQKKAAKKPAGRSSGSSAASEAQLALAQAEQRQVEEAMRRSKAEADAKAAMREKARQAEVAANRNALAGGDYDYEDSVELGVKIQQAQTTKSDLKFQAVASAPGSAPERTKRMSIGGDSWNDMSISCWYVGTFEVGKANKIDKAEVKRGIHTMKEYIKNQREATLIICLEGMKVIDTTSNKVAMAHALSRVSMAAADSQLPLFGFVAKNPGVPDKFCHVFNMNTKGHAEHLQGLVMTAFRLAFANEKQNQLKASAAGRPGAPPVPAMPKQWAKHNPLPGRASGAGQARAPMQRPAAQPQVRAAARGPPLQKQTAPPQVRAAPAPAAATPAAGKGSATSIENAAWFQAGVPREIAMELLEMSDDGAFVVRDSSSQPGNYALTMKGDGLMHHFIVRKVPQGYVLGSEAQGQSPFPDLGALIIHYAQTPGCLPCCLSLDSFNKVYNEQDNDAQTEHSFVDPDYQDLVQLMAGN